METATVGKVVVSAKVENVVDLYAASKGQIPDDQVHRIEVADARVDTGATLLGMPKRLIDELAIPQIGTGRDSGMPVETTVGWIVTVAAGRIVRFDGYWNLDEALQIAGLER